MAENNRINIGFSQASQSSILRSEYWALDIEHRRAAFICVFLAVVLNVKVQKSSSHSAPFVIRHMASIYFTQK